MNNKKVYVIRLSEDGIAGVYSNMKKAFEAAKKHELYYENSKITTLKDGEIIEVKPTYENMVKEINKSGYAEFVEGGSSMEITLFYLNL